MPTQLPHHKPFSLACERNREPILAVLQRYLLDQRQVLEIGSGTGQHAVHFAQALPQLMWQCSDVADNLPGVRLWLDEAALPNTPEPVTLDVNMDMARVVGGRKYNAIYSANTLHIMGWPEVQRLFAQLPALMAEQALLVIYGPFNYGGKFTSDSNARFDGWLRSDHPKRGLRDFEAVNTLAEEAGLTLLNDVAMPANNRCLVFKKP
jgi:cyclopropane fatty-acyl-phospholipid synthase-like methyltransferase